MDFEERKKLFLEKYKEIMEECKVDILSIPMFVPEGTGAFKIIVQNTLVDLTNQPTPSNPNDFV